MINPSPYNAFHCTGAFAGKLAQLAVNLNRSRFAKMLPIFFVVLMKSCALIVSCVAIARYRNRLIMELRGIYSLEADRDMRVALSTASNGILSSFASSDLGSVKYVCNLLGTPFLILERECVILNFYVYGISIGFTIRPELAQFDPAFDFQYTHKLDAILIDLRISAIFYTIIVQKGQRRAVNYSSAKNEVGPATKNKTMADARCDS
jgi:hypothetical protein